MTLADAVHAARARLAGAGIEAGEAGRDAELLARHALDWDRATFLARRQDGAPPTFERAFETLIARRERREPVAYIRGVQEFYGREFSVSPAVLIPRPETELVVEEALAWLTAREADAQPTVVDVGTGSGCIAVTIACETRARVVATDTSEAAISVAQANAARHQVKDQVRCEVGTYLGSVKDKVDLIVANPPYVAETEAASLPPEVGCYEPRAALFAGVDGLRDIRALIERAATELAPGGALILEIGAGQAESVRGAVSGMPGLVLVRVREDLQGIPRTAIFHRR